MKETKNGRMTWAIGLLGGSALLLVLAGCDRDRSEPSSVTETRSGQERAKRSDGEPAPPPVQAHPEPAKAVPIDTGSRLNPTAPEASQMKEKTDKTALESKTKAAAGGDLPAFEGELKMNVPGGAPESIDYAMKGDKIRLGLRGTAGTNGKGVDAIIDTDDKKAVVLLNDKKQYVEVDLAKLATKAKNRLENVRVEKVGETDTVAGKTCERWKIIDRDVQVNACVTKGAPYFDLDALEQQGGFRAPNWIHTVIDAGYVPLRVSIVDAKGARLAGARVTDMSTNVEDRQFEVPPGFTKTTPAKAGAPEK